MKMRLRWSAASSSGARRGNKVFSAKSRLCQGEAANMLIVASKWAPCIYTYFEHAVWLFALNNGEPAWFQAFMHLLANDRNANDHQSAETSIRKACITMKQAGFLHINGIILLHHTWAARVHNGTSYYLVLFSSSLSSDGQYWCRYFLHGVWRRKTIFLPLLRYNDLTASYLNYFKVMMMMFRRRNVIIFGRHIQ